MSPEILIVDNDPIVCGLSNELLREAGFTTQMIHDGKLAVAAIREGRPRAVLLDILMPGVDGLTLCRTIKADVQLRDTKVVIVSGKAFETEKERAKRYGADSFIEKPYDVDTFSQKIIEIVGRPQNPAPTGPVQTIVQTRVWGCRSLPSNAPSIPAAGLHTPCVSVETEDKILIFDAGSGITALGQEILNAGTHKDLWIFLTHFHPAHVLELGTFPCTRSKGFNIRICGPNDPDKTLEDCVRGAFQTSFSADPKPIQAAMQLYVFQEGDYDVAPGVRIRAFYANHPTTTLGYCVETMGRRIVYCPDSEIYGHSASALQDYDEMLVNICHGADLLIHDARYRAAEYEARKNQGHSSVAETADFAARAEVARLMLFHQDASYSPSDVQAMEREALQSLQAKNSGVKCLTAREGLALSL